jgi:hypothetical protein
MAYSSFLLSLPGSRTVSEDSIYGIREAPGLGTTIGGGKCRSRSDNFPAGGIPKFELVRLLR